jgi:ABC-type nickel/cobalt efflux system permease component RcnA
MQTSDMEFFLNLQKFAILFSFAVGLAIIVAAIALCFVAIHTASIRDELLRLRVQAEMDFDRRVEKKEKN